jgi:transposase
MGKSYRKWDAQRGRQQACVPEVILREDDLVFFLMDIIPTLDLSAFHSYYQGETRGQPPFDVTMMVILLTYSYCVGVFSSRKIAAACERNLAFRVIVGDDAPNFRTISDFRKIHEEAMKALFLEVLRLAGELGMVRLGNLSTDGTKIDANASRHKAMSYGYMEKEEERLKAEIEELMKKSQQMDDADDAMHGSRRGDELPDELKRREERLEKIREAKARLEAEAQARAAEAQRQRDEAEAAREAEGRARRGKAPQPIDPTPEAKAQTNFTDPESKCMKQPNKGFNYSYNAQTVVDDMFQIIVAADVTGEANDKRQAGPMARATVANLNAAGIELPRAADGQPVPPPITGDSGYFSAEAVAEVELAGLDPYFAVGREKHHEATASDTTAAATASPITAPEGAASATMTSTPATVNPSAPSGGPSVSPSDHRLPASTQEAAGSTPARATSSAGTSRAAAAAAATARAKESMKAKLQTESGRALYAARKYIVEPVYGQIKHVRGFRKFLRRGKTAVRSEWQLVSLTHNLLKIWRYAWS